MATVTGLTAQRMIEMEAQTVIDGEVQGDNLILTTRDGTPIDAGNVRGVKGDQGTPGTPGTPGIINSVNDVSAPAVYSPRIFPTKADLDLWTPNAPLGAMAVTTDSKLLWEKDEVGWFANAGMRTFASAGERNTRWLNPPNGAMCVTLDTHTIWMWNGSNWIDTNPPNVAQPMSETYYFNGTSQVGIGAAEVIGYLQLPPKSFARTVTYFVMCRVDNESGGGNSQCNIESGSVLANSIMTHAAGQACWHYPTAVVNYPANTSPARLQYTVLRQSGTGTFKTYADPKINHMYAISTPDGFANP